MQATINGKLYDTDEATKICEYSECNDSDDFKYTCTLWKTEKGDYFFEGIYGLRPCTKDEAKDFFQEDIDGKIIFMRNKLAIEFGEPEET